MKPSRITLLLLPLLLVALAVPAWAEDEEPSSNDLKERIRKKMEGILELMRENEKALLKLSTGTAAKTKKVDVEVPDSPKGKSGGAAGSDGNSGTTGAKGGEIGRKLDELIEGQRKSGGKIPDELKQLVEMIPL
ncbi:MAG: hypothetical protein QNJ90_09110 [Planctomycetota bacterium]|nr:hypothetical protein [Planctomycetota bacterium]